MKDASQVLRSLRGKLSPLIMVDPKEPWSYVNPEHEIIGLINPTKDQLVETTIALYRLPNDVVMEALQKTKALVCTDSFEIPVTEYEVPVEFKEAWSSTYPDYTSDNLEEKNIMVLDCRPPVVFVHHTHPIVGLLRANKALLKKDIDACSKIEDEWFKLRRCVLTAGAETLRAAIFCSARAPL